MDGIMDGIIENFPPPFTEYACPRRSQVNFHGKTRSTCRDGMAGNVGLKVVKSIVIGDLSVGKTSLINRYCRNLFEKDYKPTIGVEFEMKKYKILGQEFHMQMWDTSGEERFKSITGAYYRGAHTVIVIFDMTDPHSFANASNWLDDALEKTRSTTPEIFLVGNKVDLMVSCQNVKEFFTRAAALCFDQAVLRETASTRESKTQLGKGSMIKTQKPSESIVLGREPTSGSTEDRKYIHEAYDRKKAHM